MKKILFLVIVLALVLIPYQVSRAATKAYDYELIAQSSYPATLAPGEVASNLSGIPWWPFYRVVFILSKT